LDAAMANRGVMNEVGLVNLAGLAPKLVAMATSLEQYENE